LNLADYARIRVLADRLGVETLDREGPAVVLKFRERRTTVDPVRLINLVKERGDLAIFPPATVKLDLSKAGEELPHEPADRSESGPGPRRPGPPPDAWSRASAARRRAQRKPAWWATRATAGAVMPGFSKAEILKAPPEDPRAPNGVLDRVTGLLLALTDEQ
jgi:hypothetical protein